MRHISNSSAIEHGATVARVMTSAWPFLLMCGVCLAAVTAPQMGRSATPPQYGEVGNFVFSDESGPVMTDWPGRGDDWGHGYPHLVYIGAAQPYSVFSIEGERLTIAAKFGGGDKARYFKLNGRDDRVPLGVKPYFEEKPRIEDAFKALGPGSGRVFDPRSVLFFVGASSLMRFGFDLKSSVAADPVADSLGERFADILPCLTYPKLMELTIFPLDPKDSRIARQNVAFVLKYLPEDERMKDKAEPRACALGMGPPTSSLASIDEKTQFAPTTHRLYISYKYAVYELPFDVLLDNVLGESRARSPSLIAKEENIRAQLRGERERLEADAERRQACLDRIAECAQEMVDRAYLAAAQDERM